MTLNDITFISILAVATGTKKGTKRYRPIVERFFVAVPSESEPGRLALCSRAGKPSLVEYADDNQRRAVAKKLGAHGGKATWTVSDFHLDEDGSVPEKAVKLAVTRWEDKYTVGTDADREEFESQSRTSGIGKALAESYRESARADFIQQFGAPMPAEPPVDLDALKAEIKAGLLAEMAEASAKAQAEADAKAKMDGLLKQAAMAAELAETMKAMKAELDALKAANEDK